MQLTELPKIAEDIANAVFEHGWQSVIHHLLKRRAQAAKEILVDKLRRGDIFIEEIGDRDEAAAMFVRFLRAATEGAARKNLKLMASVIASQLQHRPIYADEFLRWADLLTSLTREEIILALTLHQNHRPPDEPELEIHPTAGVITSDQLEYGKRVMAAYTIAQHNTQVQLCGDGKIFQDREEFELTASSLLRTGLLVVGTDGVYRTTSRLSRLLKLIDVEDAISDDLN